MTLQRLVLGRLTIGTVSVCDDKPTGIRNTVQEFLGSFSVYDWLWRDDKDKVNTHRQTDMRT
jgi:hypothetical protein